jgi:hypothetical protein
MDSVEYNPVSTLHRHTLAEHLLKMLGEADFVEEAVSDKGTKERVFYRVIPESAGVRVQVYTTIVGYGDAAEVRVIGKDAIRVCAVYRSRREKSDRGVVSVTRVHRTGTMDAICARTLARMREVYTKAGSSPTCSQCGAPTFVSKKGNVVCADICFAR